MDVKTALRIFELYEQFAEAARPLAVSELAERMGIPVSSCFSLVKTAERLGYMYSLKPRGPLYPTRRMLDLMEVIAANDPTAERVLDLLRELRDTTQETVVLGQLVGKTVRYLAAFASPQVIRYEARAGEIKSVNTNSIGKALLGLMPDVERSALLAQMDFIVLTPATLPSPAALTASVVEGCARGWHENFGESVADLGALAAGITISGMPFGISVVGPLPRIVASRDAIATSLLEVVERINQRERASLPSPSPGSSRRQKPPTKQTKALPKRGAGSAGVSG